MFRITRLVSLARHTHEDHHFVRKGLFSKGEYPRHHESSYSSKTGRNIRHQYVERSSPNHNWRKMQLATALFFLPAACMQGTFGSIQWGKPSLHHLSSLGKPRAEPTMLPHTATFGSILIRHLAPWNFERRHPLSTPGTSLRPTYSSESFLDVRIHFFSVAAPVFSSNSFSHAWPLRFGITSTCSPPLSDVRPNATS